MPDVLGVFPDSTVGGEDAGLGDIDQGLGGEGHAVGIGVGNILLRAGKRAAAAMDEYIKNKQ